MGKKGSKWTSPEVIAEARRLRGLGMDYDQICEATGLQRASAHRYCKDVQVPKKVEPTKASLRRHKRLNTEFTRQEKLANRNSPDDSQPPSRFLPSTMPPDPEEFDTSGLLPDPALIAHANGVLDRYFVDKAAGKIFHGVPPAVWQAQIVVTTMLMPWDPQWWRDNRDHWEAVRQFTRVSSTEMAGRCGISPSSLSRYERATRTPSKGDMERMRLAYWAAMEHRYFNLDLWLGLESYVEHLAAGGHDVDAEDFTYEYDEAIRWISGVGADLEDYGEELSIEHLPYVAQVRSLMPVPAYRNDDEMLFGYVGFATGTDDEASAA